VALAPLAAPAAAITSGSGAGAGPFVPGARGPRRLDLSPFADHVRGRPYLDHVALVATGEADAAQAELDAGRAQVVLGGESDTRALGVLMLVLDPARAPLQRMEARQSVVASIDTRALVEHLVPGGDARTGLVPPLLLTPLEPPPAPARGTLSGAIEIAVSRDVPAAVSQRVLACFSDLGLDARVRPLDPAQALAAPAPARLLWWSPEVAEPLLALREAAALSPGADRAALDAAERERDPDRRRALLHRADAALRASWTLAPLAAVPLPFHARASVHGLRADPAGALLLEDAWREP
jgi:MarR-like DNA-binding transcriptional regulator SgrR of sgrS sRNA